MDNKLPLVNQWSHYKISLKWASLYNGKHHALLMCEYTYQSFLCLLKEGGGRFFQYSLSKTSKLHFLFEASSIIKRQKWFHLFLPYKFFTRKRSTRSRCLQGSGREILQPKIVFMIFDEKSFSFTWSIKILKVLIKYSPMERF